MVSARSITSLQSITSLDQTAQSWDKLTHTWINAVNQKLANASSNSKCIKITDQDHCKKTILSLWAPDRVYHAWGWDWTDIQIYQDSFRLVCREKSDSLEFQNTGHWEKFNISVFWWTTRWIYLPYNKAYFCY